MRIIAGKYRGRKLNTPQGGPARPTSDRLRETLFNILAPQIENARFLDLCAGTGAVGLEAISRGASHVTFVEQSRKMCGLIGDNRKALGIEDNAFELINAEALDFLRRHVKQGNGPFDVIFFDPPYASDYEGVLEFAAASDAILGDGAVMILEHFKKRELLETAGRLKRYRVVKQGDSMLSFYRRPD